MPPRTRNSHQTSHADAAATARAVCEESPDEKSPDSAFAGNKVEALISNLVKSAVKSAADAAGQGSRSRSSRGGTGVKEYVEKIFSALKDQTQDPREAIFDGLPYYAGKGLDVDTFMDSPVCKSFLADQLAHQGDPNQLVSEAMKPPSAAAVASVGNATGKSTTAARRPKKKRQKKVKNGGGFEAPLGINLHDPNYDEVYRKCRDDLWRTFSRFMGESDVRQMVQDVLPKVLNKYTPDAENKLRGGAISVPGGGYIHATSSRSKYPRATCNVTLEGSILVGFKCEPSPGSSTQQFSLDEISTREKVGHSRSQNQVVITCPANPCQHQFVTKAENVIKAIECGMKLTPGEANVSFFESETLTDYNIQKKGSLMIPANTFQFLQKSVHVHFADQHDGMTCTMCRRQDLVKKT
mmetsp:Transcript_25800/g.61283  ORF Transcript_25800/g.61283 Transcript_25800/m.61283 type:complete len:410 (+) Transcript_25800:117-1346(+)